jgi:hypothetical protein
MTNYAIVEARRAALSEEFGRELLVKKFGQAAADVIIAEFGTYKRGKRKGQAKGFIHWKKCTRGGWKHYEGRSGGYVAKPGSFDFAVSLNFERKDRECIGERISFAGNATDEQWIEAVKLACSRIKEGW